MSENNVGKHAAPSEQPVVTLGAASVIPEVAEYQPPAAGSAYKTLGVEPLKPTYPEWFRTVLYFFGAIVSIAGVVYLAASSVWHFGAEWDTFVGMIMGIFGAPATAFAAANNPVKQPVS